MKLWKFFDIISFSFLVKKDNNNFELDNYKFIKKENYKQSKIVYNMNNILQYESYLPIDALVFYIGAYSPSDNQLDKIINNILKVKKLVLDNREVINSFNNFSDIFINKNELNMLIKIRNQLLNSDRSYIMKNITKEFLNKKILKSKKKKIKRKNSNEIEIENGNINENEVKTENSSLNSINPSNNNENLDFSNLSNNLNLSNIIQENENENIKKIQEESSETSEYNIINGIKIIKILYLNKNKIFDKENKIKDFGRDEEYRKMIFRLKSVIEENKNVNKQVQQEKEEFYRKFVTYSVGEILRTKIAISLGSYIISTSMLPIVIGNIDVVDKDVKIREWMHKIMKHVENIELNIGTKSAFEKKYIVKEFLEECIDRKNEELDKLFELRSNILITALKSKKSLERINIKQERHIKKLIKVVENMKDEEWIIKYNKDIVEDFIKFLLTNQKRDKETLLRHFIN